MSHSAMAIGLFALLGCASAEAQTLQLKASIPFEFQVGKVRMPAGTYTMFHDNNVLRIVKSGHTHAVLAIANKNSLATPAAHSRLRFNRYGNEYFLSGVWQRGVQTGLSFAPGKRERELIASGMKPVQENSVTVAKK